MLKNVIVYSLVPHPCFDVLIKSVFWVSSYTRPPWEGEEGDRLTTLSMQGLGGKRELIYVQKLSPGKYLHTKCSWKFGKIHIKTPVIESLSWLSCRLQPKERPWHRRFPSNFKKFLRKTFLQNTWRSFFRVAIHTQGRGWDQEFSQKFWWIETADRANKCLYQLEV